MSEPAPLILVVDDNPRNRELARALLEREGYRVVCAEDGVSALACFTADRADLVLLDAIMPGLDGFDTCTQLRALPGGADVPIVFCTGLDDIAAHDRALASGADDFLNKPVTRTALVMRVRSLLRIQNLQRQVRQRDERAAETTRYLVHDINNQLASQLANAYFLTHSGELKGDMQEAALGVELSVRAVQRMVANLADVARSHEGSLECQPSRFDLEELIDELATEHGERARLVERELSVAATLSQSVIVADRYLLHRLLGNLLDNAFKHAPRGSVITLAARDDGPTVALSVTDQGSGVPEHLRATVFEPYVQLSETGGPRSTSRGLGLTFCRLAAELHGGRIWVEDNDPRGSRFCVELPSRRRSAPPPA